MILKIRQIIRSNDLVGCDIFKPLHNHKVPAAISLINLRKRVVLSIAYLSFPQLQTLQVVFWAMLVFNYISKTITRIRYNTY